MRIKNGKKKEKGPRHVLGDEGGNRHDLPHHLGKIFTEDTRKWQSITASEYGRTFGDRNSAALGANLFRDERAAEVKRQMKTVETILKSFENDKHVLESRNSLLPFLNPHASTLRVRAGHIKVDLSAQEMHVISGSSPRLSSCTSAIWIRAEVQGLEFRSKGSELSSCMTSRCNIALIEPNRDLIDVAVIQPL